MWKRLLRKLLGNLIREVVEETPTNPEELRKAVQHTLTDTAKDEVQRWIDSPTRKELRDWAENGAKVSVNATETVQRMFGKGGR